MHINVALCIFTLSGYYRSCVFYKEVPTLCIRVFVFVTASQKEGSVVKRRPCVAMETTLHISGGCCVLPLRAPWTCTTARVSYNFKVFSYMFNGLFSQIYTFDNRINASVGKHDFLNVFLDDCNIFFQLLN